MVYVRVRIRMHPFRSEATGLASYLSIYLASYTPFLVEVAWERASKLSFLTLWREIRVPGKKWKEKKEAEKKIPEFSPPPPPLHPWNDRWSGRRHLEALSPPPPFAWKSSFSFSLSLSLSLFFFLRYFGFPLWKLHACIQLSSERSKKHRKAYTSTTMPGCCCCCCCWCTRM